jgi:hypothetical protein
MASVSTFPDAPVDDPIRAVIGEPSAGAGMNEDPERGRGMEIVGEIRPSAETVPTVGVTEPDSVLADLPVGSWFG